MSFDDERKKQIERNNDVLARNEDGFEQKLLYISSGTLLLSLTFIEKVRPFEECSSLGLLIGGWLFLALALLINIGSLLLNAKFILIKNNDLRKAVEDEKKEKIRKEKSRRLNKISRSVNLLTYILLVLGISFIVVFCINNAQEKNKSLEKKITTQSYSHGK